MMIPCRMLCVKTLPTSQEHGIIAAVGDTTRLRILKDTSVPTFSTLHLIYPNQDGSHEPSFFVPRDDTSRPPSPVRPPT